MVDTPLNNIRFNNIGLFGLTSHMHIIDPHIHLFDLSKGDYFWLDSNNPPFWKDKSIIAKNFDESNLMLAPNELNGFVHIEAGFNNKHPTHEIAWLEETITCSFKSIATLDLTATLRANEKLLTKLQNFSSFVGVRHILDDNALTLLNNINVQKHFKLLDECKIIFELQISLVDSAIMPVLLSTIQNNPNLIFVLNHAGFPPYFIESTDIRFDKLLHSKWQSWLSNIQTIAQCKNVWMKCSGWEMAERNYQLTWLSQVVLASVAAFGENRVMLASNFPLTLFTCSFQHYWQQASKLTPKILSEKLCFKNAQQCYQFSNALRPK